MRKECTLDDFEPHLDTIVAYRASFAQPLDAVHRGLLDVHDEVDVDGETSRRLKKLSTIIDKLWREPGLDLSRMQDIGGCRSVVETRDELQALRYRIDARWDCRTKDYVLTPRDSGYRAVHMIVEHDGHAIEIQLRTKTMHTWAQTVEAFSSILGENYKQDGDHIVQQYMVAMSALMNATECGRTVQSEVTGIVDRLRPQVMELISGITQPAEQENL